MHLMELVQWKEMEYVKCSICPYHFYLCWKLVGCCSVVNQRVSQCCSVGQAAEAAQREAEQTERGGRGDGALMDEHRKRGGTG